MFSVKKARRTLERWLLSGEDDQSHSLPAQPEEQHLSSSHSRSPQARVAEFMDELRATPQEWLGRVRLVSLDAVKDKLGATWPKLRDKVEILAGKVIEREITAHDRYVNIGAGEFLVFFADATPEESRIRCFAIIESIRTKLFGKGPAAGSRPAIAECHLLHRDELEWAAKGQEGSGGPDPDPTTVLRISSRHEPEIIDSAGLMFASENAIESILGRALQSRAVEDLEPILLRLKYLSRSLKVLEPMLHPGSTDANNSFWSPAISDDDGLQGTEAPGVAPSHLFGSTWDDIVQLISVLDAAPEQSLAERLSALHKLERTRTERVDGGTDSNAALPRLWQADRSKVRYLPVYRSVANGERILRGIYRVEPSIPEWPEYIVGRDNPSANPFWRDNAIRLERAILEHAVDYLLEREPLARFVLMVSVHVDTLRGPHSQMRYSMVLRSGQLRVKRHLLIEVVGYRDTDDTIGIRRAINELRAHSNAVFLTLANSANVEKVAAQCKSLGVHALGIDLSQYGDRMPVIASLLNNLRRAGHQHSVSCFSSGISSVPILAKAIGSGVQYFSAPALRPAVPTPDEMDTVTLDDLYATV